nr:integrase, catalytic region, zinc finger, CCHC-type, peptidase aspartic, catalytic [Tanacetum cinerariifolium]
MKSLKEKVEDRLVKQYQSLQTVHMLCRPRPLYNNPNKVAIGYKNPLCLTHAKQAQPALYNGHEILKDNHAQAKRITPSANTDGERGFEQTKACYLQEVIPFFQTIKDNFKGIQKALTKEVKQMKDVFEELEAEVAQSENVTLKTSVSKAKVQPSVLPQTKHAVDVELIVPRLRNNRDAHLDYLRHLKESVEIICDIVEEAKVLAYTPLIRKKQVTATKPSDRQDSNKNKHVVTQKIQKTNVPMPHSTGVKHCPKVGGSHPKSNHKTNRISPAKGANKLPIEDLPRTNKSHLRTTNRVASNSRLKRTTPYELVHNKKPDLTFFKVFGALCYPTNDSEDLGKLQPTADTGILVGYAPSRKVYRIYNKRTRRIMETIRVQFDELTEPMAPVHRPAPTFLTPGQISSGLVSNPVPATPYAPPTNKELEILFQPMFDEYLEPPRAERPDSPAQAVQVSVTSAGTPLSTTIDQDAPSPYISPSSLALQSHSLPPGVVAEPYFMEDHNVAPVDNNPFVNIFALKPHSEASSSGDISSTESPYISQTLHHLNK